MILMQILIGDKVFEVGINKIPEKQEKLKRNGFLQILIQMRKIEQLSSRPQIANQFFIIFFLVPLIVIALFLILVMLSVIKEFKNNLSEIILLFDGFFVVNEHTRLICRLMIRKKLKYLIQSIWSHRIVLFTIPQANELLQKLVSPEFIKSLQLFKQCVEVLVQ